MGADEDCAGTRHSDGHERRPGERAQAGRPPCICAQGACSRQKSQSPTRWGYSRTREIAMHYRLMADLVVVVHLAFILFVVAGSLLARRCQWLPWLHVPSLMWAAGSITIGLPCPLTPLEKLLRGLGGEGAYRGGFIDHYVEGVLYPESLTPLLRALACLAIVVGYTSVYSKRRTAATDAPIAAPCALPAPQRHSPPAAEARRHEWRRRR